VLSVCAHLRCELEARSRNLCPTHYKRLMRTEDPVRLRMTPDERRQSDVEIRAADGVNDRCVGCGASPLFGGMRCLPCFQARCEARRQAPGGHVCRDHDPSVKCYLRCACRCAACRSAKSGYARSLREAS
jgi:hypothetical protein